MKIGKKYLLIIVIIIGIVAVGVIFLLPIGHGFTYRLSERIACQFKGGSWGYTSEGIWSEPGCFTSYLDGGKECTSSSECIGRCLIPSPYVTKGTCEKDDRKKEGRATIENPAGGMHLQ